MSEVLVDYEGTRVSAVTGDRLLDAILRAGIDHRHLCGGRGFCTTCRVEVLEGAANLSPVSAPERDRLGRDAGELRLACQCQVRGPVSIRPARPRSSRFSLGQQ